MSQETCILHNLTRTLIKRKIEKSLLRTTTNDNTLQCKIYMKHTKLRPWRPKSKPTELAARINYPVQNASFRSKHYTLDLVTAAIAVVQKTIKQMNDISICCVKPRSFPSPSSSHTLERGFQQCGSQASSHPRGFRGPQSCTNNYQMSSSGRTHRHTSPRRPP